MKKYIYILLCSSLLSMYAKAQFIQDIENDKKDFPKKTILKTNPLALFCGSIPFAAEYRLTLEKVMSNKYSLQISGSYLGKGPLLTLSETADTIPVFYLLKGYRVQVELKYYLNDPFSEKKAPTGFYIAPAYSYSYAKLSNRYLNAKNKYQAFNYTFYCLKLGYQKTYNNLAIDFFTGAGYRDNILTDYTTNKPFNIDLKGLRPYEGHLKVLLGFNVGWAFD